MRWIALGLLIFLSGCALSSAVIIRHQFGDGRPDVQIEIHGTN